MTIPIPDPAPDPLREAQIAYLVAVLAAYTEASELGLAYAKEPEYQHLAALMRAAEQRELDYYTLRVERIARTGTPPPDAPPVGALLPVPAPLAPLTLVNPPGEPYQPAPHLVAEAHACAGDKQRCFLPATHFYDGWYYCGIHCPLSEQEDPVAAAEGEGHEVKPVPAQQESAEAWAASFVAPPIPF